MNAYEVEAGMVYSLQVKLCDPYRASWGEVLTIRRYINTRTCWCHCVPKYLSSCITLSTNMSHYPAGLEAENLLRFDGAADGWTGTLGGAAWH